MREETVLKYIISWHGLKKVKVDMWRANFNYFTMSAKGSYKNDLKLLLI